MMNKRAKPWYKSSFRRSLTDMHIPDWDGRFLSEFEPQNYVEMLELAHVDTAMIYATSCLGIAYWPTKVGHMHKGIQGRDTLGELIEGCHGKGMNVIVYYNFWSKWAYDEHPEWRVVSEKGEGTAEYLWDKGRYGVCCFNTPYRSFMISQIEELCERYEFEGMWIDMIFWPYTVCYCSGCRKRYHQEIGGDMPRVVDWQDPGWVRFQRKREEWLAEFTGEITAVIKARKPDATVGHQCSAWSVGWKAGMSGAAFQQSDYTSGDFYGDALHQSFTCKAFYHLTENKPFEYMTSRCPDLTDHTTNKPKELLRAHMYACMANQGGFLFIDAIDPVGTLDQHVYATMGELYKEVEAYETYMNHDALFCQDVAIYINFESEIPLYEGEKALIARATQAAKSLIEANIPYGVVTKKNLHELSRFQVVILPNVGWMDEEEVTAFKKYVEQGGGLYASKRTSLWNKDGIEQADFQLADLFGVSYAGETEEQVTYMAPAAADGKIFSTYSRKYPATIQGSQMLVTAAAGVQTVANITLPFVNPKIIGKFASAISNPPGIQTDWPAIVQNNYGQGKVVYAAGDLEGVPHEGQRAIFTNLIRSLASKPFYFESDAPKSVEITLFYDQSAERYLIYMLNFQAELPNIPVEGIQVKIRMDDDMEPGKLLWVPQNVSIDYQIVEGHLVFTAPRLETFHLLVLEKF
ncbi:beta-galactosidase trimerization domain-containing protein [Paenibacillus eucommiae]|uniref:Beta-galactosidase trimerisation domain-containing protein n=1 Tax=Paenibacillus eucommiae TaxID=1355755 RepID=A0ABS4IMG9_9BACL|nr:beta-galactosidase trimerization domain-containing protein [Paenibacillus eucommiae]MBP1988761.1 hypothetical protein [Paenibacillus eucommiae]